MATQVQTCFRHSDRRAGVRCQRCDRPICPECMHQASVGFHCPECVQSSPQTVIRGRDLRGPGAATAAVTVALVIVNVAIYVVSSLEEGMAQPARQFTEDWALLGRGLVPGSGVLGVAEGEWYRLVTGGFLHGGLMHLGFNMFVLWMLGRMLEPAIGRAAFAAVYGTSLLAGSLGVVLLDPHVFTVGASGAVFGLFGYLVVDQLARGVNPMQTGIGGIVLINLVFTFVVPGVSIGGHLGGLAGGAVAGLLHRAVGARGPAGVTAVSVLGLGLAVASVAVSAGL